MMSHEALTTGTEEFGLGAPLRRMHVLGAAIVSYTHTISKRESRTSRVCWPPNCACVIHSHTAITRDWGSKQTTGKSKQSQVLWPAICVVCRSDEFVPYKLQTIIQIGRQKTITQKHYHYHHQQFLFLLINISCTVKLKTECRENRFCECSVI